jgi:hypothetical protein
MKGIISRLLMHRKISIVFLFLMLINSFAFSQRRNNSSLSLDTTCVFENDPVLVELDIDSDELIESDNKSFTIFSIDSIQFTSLMSKAEFFVDTTTNYSAINIVSDSELIIKGNIFYYLFSSKEIEGEQENIKGDTTIINGVLPSYWGMIPKLNLAIVSAVDVNGAYSTTNLIDMNSGNMIQDLSSYDEGSNGYLPNKSTNYIISYSSAFYEEKESEVIIIKVVKNKKSYCLDLSTVINLKKQYIESLSWISKNSFCFSSIKNYEGLEQHNFYQVVLK